MEDKAFENLLRAMEQQNRDELSDDTPHRFSKAFDKKALALCRGQQTAPRQPRRPMPLWACVLIIVLLTAMITGCALAYFFSRAIPFYGISDGTANVLTYSSTEPLSFDGLTVETVLYVRDGEVGELLMWAHSETDVPYGFSTDSTSVVDITVDGEVYGMMCVMKKKTEDGYDIVTRAGNVPASKVTEVTVTYGEQAEKIALTDISRMGYDVSKWAQIDGMTVKILPLYTNNRLLSVSVEGKRDASVRLTARVYDDLGNCTEAVGGDYLGNVMTCEQTLLGNIVRIEIVSLYISETLPEPTVTVPLTEEAPSALTLLDTPAFKEQITEIRQSGVHWGIHTRLVPKSDDYTDISVSYSFKPVRHLHTYTDHTDDNLQTFAYMLEETKQTEVSISALRYSYTLRHKDGSPLGVIEIEKQ